MESSGDEMLTEYQRYQTMLERCCGHKRCLVLYANSQFHEIVTFEEAVVKLLCQKFSLMFAKYNMLEPAGPTNPYLIGWPSKSNQMFVDHLVSQGFTVAIVDVVNRDSSGKIRRAITDIQTQTPSQTSAPESA